MDTSEIKSVVIVVAAIVSVDATDIVYCSVVF